MSLDLDKIKAANKELRNRHDEQKKELLELFSSACNDLFAQFEGLKSFGWLQYTPYFNDGDPCEFGVCCDRDWDMTLNGVCERDFEDEVFYELDQKTNKELKELYEEHPTLKPIKNLQEVVDFIPKFIYSFEEEILELLGEGLITIHKDGKVTVDEYSHE